MKIDWILISSALPALLLLPLLIALASRQSSAKRDGAVRGELNYALHLNRASLMMFIMGMLHLITGILLTPPFNATGAVLAAMGGFFYNLTLAQSSR